MKILFNPFTSKFTVTEAGTPTVKAINAQTGISYTLVLTDNNKNVTLTNSANISLNIPKYSDVAFSVGDVVECIHRGDEYLGVYPDDGVTIRSINGGRSIREQYGVFKFVNIAEDDWFLLGDVSHGAVYGYFAGGLGYSSALTDRISFATGVTSANTVSNLSSNRETLGACSDVVSYGYLAGGEGGASLVTTDRIVFSTSVTSANTVSDLSQGRSNLYGISDGSTYGYFAGGYTSAVVVTADRIVFSTGATSANTVSNLSQARQGLAGVSDGSTYGYFAGGTTGAYVVTAERVVFSTGATSANTVSNLSEARGNLGGLSNGVTYGYFAGGQTASVGQRNTTDRIVFSTGATSANTVSNLSSGKDRLFSVSDGIIVGYFVGGKTSDATVVVTADRIVFSSGVTSANTVSNLSTARYRGGSLSDFAV